MISLIRMISKGKNRIIVSWLLLAVFALPLITKTIHIYENEYETECCTHSGDHRASKHDCDSCPVCQFTLSSFVKTELTCFNSALTISYFPVFTLYQEEVYNSISHNFYLRAPPTFANLFSLGYLS